MRQFSRKGQNIREMIVFSLVGSMMYIVAQIDIVPNVHPLALFVAVFTLVYRVKALIPIYLYVFLEGLFGGFSLWWVPYLYIWTVLFGMVMLIPRRLPVWLTGILVTICCMLHGIGFGFLYAPVQCFLFFGGDFSYFWPWVAAGLPFDLLHMMGNGAASLFAIPLTSIICRLDKKELPFRMPAQGKAIRQPANPE